MREMVNKAEFRETNLAQSHRRWFLKLRPVKVSRLQRQVFWERNKQARAGHVGMGQPLKAHSPVVVNNNNNKTHFGPCVSLFQLSPN